MNYEFAIIPHINVVLDAIKDRPEIPVIRDEENMIGSIMYNVAFEDTFLDPTEENISTDERLRRTIIREARGLKFDLYSGKVISRPYQKFFNLNERPETRVENIDWSLPHVVLEKLDGSMIMPILAHNGLKWGTKRGVTKVIETLMPFINDKQEILAFSEYLLKSGMTPIYEWCSPKQQIIIKYPEERFVLVAIRDNVSGKYMSYNRMVEFANNHGITDVIKTHECGSSIHEIMQNIRDAVDFEGVVIRFESGHMIKLKGDWYVRIHKTLENLKFEKDVINIILNDDVDDIMPFLTDNVKNAITRFHKEIYENMFNNALAVLDFVAKHDGKNKKEFAEIVLNDPIMVKYQKFVFRAFSTKSSQLDVVDDMKNEMLKWVSSQTRVDAARHIIGKTYWSEILKDIELTDEDVG